MGNNTSCGLVVDGHPVTAVALPHIWSYCAGAGRANEVLRADWQMQMREAADRLGFRYVRFHGLFHDDMFVYRDTYGVGFGMDEPLDEPVFTFSYVDKVIDFLLEIGVRPFVELGFMPSGLATQTSTVFWWGAHCSPPNDMSRWIDLVTATVEHWGERYGLEEVREWRFEVWNEPNLVPFFWTGTKTQYFELYEATVTALKAIDSRLKVGGPSTSVFVADARYAGEVEDRSAQHATAAATDVDALPWRPVWVEDFLAWCHERHVPVDFVSTHVYPTDVAFGSSGEWVPIVRYVDATYDDLTLLRKLVSASAYPKAEIHVTEWSSSPSSRDAMHDTIYAATYVTRTYLQCSAIPESLSYWTFTDVFEEGGAGIGPFHGGFGLINEQGIHKPTFHAFEMLERLGDVTLFSADHGVLTQHSTDSSLAAVFYNYPSEMGKRAIGSQSSYERTRDLAEIGAELRVAHRVEGLCPGTVFDIEILDLEHGNVAEAWYRAGAPINLSPQQTSHLRLLADDLARGAVVVDDAGVLDIDIRLGPWAVASVVQRD